VGKTVADNLIDGFKSLKTMRAVKLTVQVKLLPTPEQAESLRHTLEIANAAADKLSAMAWEKKEFRRFPLHKLYYRKIRDEFPLSAQIVCLLTAKVADSYKLDHDTQRHFRKHGSIAYDSRILSFDLVKSLVSLWTVAGRKRIAYICGDKQRTLLKYPRGEADLIFRKRKWFLNVTVEVPEEKEHEAIDALGVDLGIVEIAYDSDGRNYSGRTLNKIRNRNLSLRAKLQRIGTKSAKRLLKKRSKREANFARNTNHIISKSIVQTAKRTNRAIAIEKLTGIRARVRARKSGRTSLHSWGFAQLGGFLKYKAALIGVRLVEVDPRNTSRRCFKCGHTAKENRKSQSVFSCVKCGYQTNADGNGADNIRLKGLEIIRAGAINHPNAEAISCGQVHDCIHLQAGSN
jgi:IS605 OrfB family transposase